MTVIDAHCHVSPHWYEPVEILLHQMDRAGVDRAILTCTNYQRSFQYELECVARFPGRLSFIGTVEIDSPSEAPRAVTALASRGAAGLRLKLGSGGVSARDVAILSAAGEAGLPISLLATAVQLGAPDVGDVLRRLPGLQLVIEHLGSSSDAEDETDADRRRAFELARFEGVHVKINGLADFCTRKQDPFVPFPFVEPIPPYLAWAHEAFGSRRLLWGSNFPTVCAHEGYENSLRLLRAQFDHLPPAETAEIFGGNALRLFVRHAVSAA